MRARPRLRRTHGIELPGQIPLQEAVLIRAMESRSQKKADKTETVVIERQTYLEAKVFSMIIAVGD